MARTRRRTEPVAYHGEVWTDARGYATVALPRHAAPLGPPFEYQLRDLEPPTTARITAGLDHGRFTIATDQPHVKVAWRVSGLLRPSRPRHPKEDEK